MISDATVGWMIIAVMCAGFYCGVTRLVRFVATSVIAAVSAQREERERVQEILDDRFRDDLFRMIEVENAETERGSKNDE